MKIADHFENGMLNSLRFFKDQGIKVGILMDTPDFPFSGTDCVEPSRRRPLSQIVRRVLSKNTPLSSCKVSRDFVVKRQFESRKIAANMAAAFPEVKVFDPLPYFCDAKECSLIIDGQIAFWDDGHLNRLGSEKLASSLTAWINLNYSGL